MQTAAAPARSIAQPLPSAQPAQTVVPSGAVTILGWIAIIANTLLKWPFLNSAVSGYDRPWMYQMQMRLWGLTWTDFSQPFQNGWVQLLGHHGQLELLPMFAWVGICRALHVPLTAFVIQLGYVAMDAAALLIVMQLAQRITGSRAAAGWAGLMYATYPMLAYVTLFPLQTNFTNLLLAGLMLIWLGGLEKPTWPRMAAAGALAAFLQLSSRIAPIDAGFLLVLYAVTGAVKRDAFGPRLLFLEGILAGIAANTFIYWVGLKIGIHVFGIYHYFFGHRNAHPGNWPMGEVLRTLGMTVVSNGGILMAASLAAALASLTLARWAGKLTLARVLLFMWFVWYLIPPVLAHRFDYQEVYFIPMIVLAVDVATMLAPRLSFAWRRAALTLAAGLIAINALWTLELVRGVRWSGVPTRLAQSFGTFLPDCVKYQLHPYAWVLKSLNADYHLQAAGYWIRRHTSEAHSIVLLPSNVWHKTTAEYYFGTPFITISKPARKRLYYVTPHGWDQLTHADLQTAQHDPERFIRSNLYEDKPFPLQGVTNFYLVCVHPFERPEEFGFVDAAALSGCEAKYRQMLDQRFSIAGRIRDDSGRPLVTIYSFQPQDLVEYNERDARSRFDREFANWEALWSRNVFAQMDNHFSGE